MIKSKKQFYIIVGAFIIALMLFTTTYAFFNYTRTGTANTIKTGRIAFNSSQGTAINLTNMFPIDPEENGIMDDASKVGTVTINVTGDTTYTGGLEYLLTAVNVTNTVGSKSLPISIDVSVAGNSNNDPATTLGTEEEEYFENRGSTTSYYRVLAKDTISTDDRLLVGYIAPGIDGVDGNIVIKAYLDKNKIAISDTYPEGDVTHTENEGTEQEEEVVDYTNGTTSTWVNGRTVFTTTEWNTLQTSGVSFQVKVEANEGIWVEEVRTVNAMNTFPTIITDEKANIKEVYFNKMGATRMQNAYDAATIKADLTYNNEGKVLAWFEENQDDNTMYNLIVASDGDTYLPDDCTGFFSYWSNVEKFEFNNINTIRVTNMTGFFFNNSSLDEIDLSNFNTTNLSNLNSTFSGCSSLKSIDLSMLDTSKVTNMYTLFNECSSLITINLSGQGGNVLSGISGAFGECNSVKQINMSNFNFGTAYISVLFGNLENLEEIDLSNVIINTIHSQGLFQNDSSLTRIYVSNSWADNNLGGTDDMFKGCTSLVGQAPNTTYAFDSNDAIDKTYAVVATDNQKGYLTDISLKP